MAEWTRSATLVVGVLVTLGLVAFHLEFYRHAGALWRDEGGTVNLAELPSYAEIIAHRRYDSFPVGWTLLMHTWMLAGLGDTDQGLRRLGLLVGLALVAALWWSGRRLRLDAPLVTLLLFGMSPTTIVYGDTVRGYGLSALAVACCMGALWSLLERPTWRAYAVAQVAALLTIQTYYGSTVLLAAVCAGAAAVCARRRDWRTLALVVTVGTLAAVVTAINLAGISSSYGFSMVPTEQGDWSLGWYLGVLRRALAPGVPLLGAFWAVAAVLALAGCVAALLPRSKPASSASDRALYVALAVPLAIAAYIGSAWRISKLPTQVWHYLPLMALIALGCDVGVSLLVQRLRSGPIIRLAVITVVALLAAGSVRTTVSMRMTNFDVAVRKVEEAVRPEDLIVVYPWTCGVTFDRYYRGAAPWITVPDVEDHKFHPILAVAEKIKQGDAGFAAELERVERVLRHGGRVWVVGGLIAPPPGQPAPHVPPAAGGGGQSNLAVNGWLMQLGALLQTHAGTIREVPLPSVGPVNVFENAPALVVAEGWQ